ncbi:MAG: hypothetical protein A3C35_07180 [Omnitrophica bacterium RIFCSPHIGHO2_02_FULL_46_11]|nr:MAG: hypothetical protein A3A81_00780 [Omnitrophica bacterium RIFCSPLOWO2_01_FULL_45_10b]OGW85942.1 MAG: hypothetical protein A3C35_07180 [Omnitrophica bacterium RIFCSPHIGHO2_02_FULL_46_11]
MKILQVVSELSPRMGGPAQAVLELSRVLAREGQAVSIFATDPDLKVFEQSHLRTKVTDVSIKLFKSIGWRHYYYSPSFKKELKQRVRDFDIVHIHGIWTYPTLAASRICKEAGVPYVIRPCGMLDRYCFSHHQLRKKIYYALAEQKNLTSAHAIHFTTEEERHRSSMNGLANQAVVIPLGLDLEPYLCLPPRGNFRKHYPHLEGKKIILFLGRINFKKGLDLLIDAFSAVLKETKEAHCIIAGPDDEGYGKRLKEWISEKGISEHVTVIGFVEGEAKLALFRDSDIFCLPSHQENFGIAVVEAMAAGLPVVISDQVNLYREIQSEQAGIVTGLNSSEIASAFLRLLQDDHLRETMAMNSRAYVKRNYQWDKIVKDLMRLYEHIIS